MAMLDEEGINNEAKLYEIAKIIDNNFFMESIKEQINAGLESTTTDYLKEFNIKLKYIVDNYNEVDYANIIDYRDDLYRNIITWLQDKYDITIDYNEDQVLTIVKQLYRFFAVDMKEAVTAFFHYYIMDNYEAILQSLDEESLNVSQLDPNKPKEQQLPILLITNIGTVVDTVIGMNITFELFMQYAATAGDIRSVNELSSVSDDILSISSEDNVLGVIMREMRDNVYDHNIVVQLSVLLMESLNISRGENENGEQTTVEHASGDKV
jgi:hypothetical protein